MDNNSGNPSLLNFLQKKSLFSNSPSNKIRNRSRSGSKDGKLTGSRSKVYQLDDRSDIGGTGQKFQYQQDNARNFERQQHRLPGEERGLFINNQRNQRIRLEPQFGDPKHFQSTAPNIQHQAINKTLNHSFPSFAQNRNNEHNFPTYNQPTVKPISPRHEHRPFAMPPPPTFSSEIVQNNIRPYGQQRMFQKSEVRRHQQYEGSHASRYGQQNQVWAELVAHNTTFQSARLQSIQCLETLSARLANQISKINFKIDNFNTAMGRALSQQFKQIRQKLLHIIDGVFRQSDRYIRDYMKQQQSRLAGDISKVRDALLKQQAKIEVMKEELKRPNWRKTAGEILTTQLEKKVEQFIRSSDQLEVGQWQLNELGGTHIQHLQRVQAQLKELVRLKPIK